MFTGIGDVAFLLCFFVLSSDFAEIDDMAFEGVLFVSCASLIFFRREFWVNFQFSDLLGLL